VNHLQESHILQFLYTVQIVDKSDLLLQFSTTQTFYTWLRRLTVTRVSVSSIPLITRTRVAAHGIVASGVAATTSIIRCALVDICVVKNNMTLKALDNRQFMVGATTPQSDSTVDYDMYIGRCRCCYRIVNEDHSIIPKCPRVTAHLQNSAGVP